MRIKIHFENEFTFTTRIPVRITDINYGGHLGNDKILAIVHEARMAYLQHLGYTEMNIEGSGIIMADSAIQYKGEGFFGDVLKVEMYAVARSEMHFDLFYKLSTERNHKVIDIAFVKTGMLCFDYNKRQIRPIPKPFLQKIVTE